VFDLFDVLQDRNPGEKRDLPVFCHDMILNVYRDLFYLNMKVNKFLPVSYHGPDRENSGDSEMVTVTLTNMYGSHSCLSDVQVLLQSFVM
jgi:hypothetical protein